MLLPRLKIYNIIYNLLRHKIFIGSGDSGFTEELRNLTGIYRREVAFELYKPPGNFISISNKSHFL